MDRRKFNSGKIGNKGGGRKSEVYKKNLAKAIEMIISTDEIIFEMANIVKDMNSSPADKIKASTFLIDQVHGKARQKMDIEVNSLLDGKTTFELEALESASRLMLEMKEDNNNTEEV